MLRHARWFPRSLVPKLELGNQRKLILARIQIKNFEKGV